MPITRKRRATRTGATDAWRRVVLPACLGRQAGTSAPGWIGKRRRGLSQLLFGFDKFEQFCASFCVKLFGFCTFLSSARVVVGLVAAAGCGACDPACAHPRNTSGTGGTTAVPDPLSETAAGFAGGPPIGHPSRRPLPPGAVSFVFKGAFSGPERRASKLRSAGDPVRCPLVGLGETKNADIVAWPADDLEAGRQASGGKAGR